jgi:ketopantoate reductase
VSSAPESITLDVFFIKPLPTDVIFESAFKTMFNHSINSTIAILDATNIKPFKTIKAIDAPIVPIGPNIPIFTKIASEAFTRG